MILHLATLDTRNYRFQALGLTEDEARAALEQAWTALEREQPASTNTSPAERHDLEATADPSDLEALASGRAVHLEAWSPDDPFGMPAAIVRPAPGA